MRQVLLTFVLCCAGITGCQHIALEHRTSAQASTLSDLHHQEVLDNLAIFVTNPDAMPFYMTAGSANTSVDRSASIDGSLGWSLFENGGAATNWYLNSASVAPKVGGSTTAQWVSNAIVNPVKLDIMRCVYQKTVNHCTPECEAKLRNCFSDHLEWMSAMTPGWYCSGTKKDVPKDACYVGHHCGTYVWVTPMGMDALTKITFAILDIATIDAEDLDDRLDPVTSAIANHYEEAKKLSDLLKSYPNQTDDTYKDLKKKLDAVLAKLPAQSSENKNQRKRSTNLRDPKPTLPFTLRPNTR